MPTGWRPAIISAAALAALYIAGALSPGNLNWGFHFLGFLPPWICWLYVAVVAAILYAGLYTKAEQVFVRLATALDRRPFLFFLLTGAIFLTCGILLRVRIPLLGDGFYLVRNYVEAFRGIAPLYPRDEPLATYFFSAIMHATGITSYQQFLTAFLTGDLLLGLGFLVNLFVIIRAMFPDPQHRLAALSFLTVLPYMQLFFGYVETYSVVLFAVSLYVMGAVLYLRDKLSFGFIPVFFLLMVLSHYLALLLIPSFILLTHSCWKHGRVKELLVGYAIPVVILVLLLLSVDFDVERFISRVPYSHVLSVAMPGDMVERSSMAYTLFSSYHVIDVVNWLVLLCAPSIILVACSYRGRGIALMKEELGRFFLAALTPVALCFFLIKFDLGAARDWDVFSPYALLFAIAAFWMCVRVPLANFIKPIVVVVLLTCVNSSLFFYINATEHAALRRYRTFFDKRTLSQNGFYNASLFLSQYYHQVRNNEEPIAIWANYCEAFPGDRRGYQNVITNYAAMGASAASELFRWYVRWREHDAHNPAMIDEFKKFCIEAGNRSFSMENFTDAARMYEQAIALDSTDPKGYNNLGSVYAQQRGMAAASAYFQTAISLDSNYAEAHYNLGILLIDTGRREEGMKHIERAARLGNEQAGHYILKK